MNCLLLNSGPCPPAFNMALDDALLEAMPRLQKPVLRFYAWTEPAATFGYFQKFSEVERATHLRPLIRRPTGGGLVPHNADWTYSLAFPTNSEWYELRAEESYRRAHEWLQAAFARLNVETELAQQPVKLGTRNSELGPPPPGQCFVGHEKFDLLWHGKKIAGAAQRRNKSGLLIQGSVQPPPLSLRRSDWQSAMCAVANPPASDEAHLQPDEVLRARTLQLVDEKYGNRAFNQRR